MPRQDRDGLTGKPAVVLHSVLLQKVLQEVLVVVGSLPDLLHVDLPRGDVKDPVPRDGPVTLNPTLPETDLYFFPFWMSS